MFLSRVLIHKCFSHYYKNRDLKGEKNQTFNVFLSSLLMLKKAQHVIATIQTRDGWYFHSDTILIYSTTHKEQHYHSFLNCIHMMKIYSLVTLWFSLYHLLRKPVAFTAKSSTMFIYELIRVFSIISTKVCLKMQRVDSVH